MSIKKKLFIHGGSSLISMNLIKLYLEEFDEFHIFCRNINKTKKILHTINNDKFFFYENNLLNLDETLKDINKLPNDFLGIFWITGSTGDPEKEQIDSSSLKNNIEINYFHPLICLNQLEKKMIINHPNSFICVITSVAGLRGRYKRLFYGSAKAGLINYLSGLRQKFNEKIKIITVIPGYMSTTPFNENGPQFLISTPEKSAKIIYDGIKKNQQIIYVNNFWRIIMGFIRLIPESMFKRLKF